MTDLNLLVRLHETVAIGPQTLPLDGGAPAPGTVILLVSPTGEGTISSGSFSSSQSFYMNAAQKPLSAGGPVKRISNPDDETQHVDVADTNKQKVGQGSGTKYQQTTKFYKTESPALNKNAKPTGSWTDQ